MATTYAKDHASAYRDLARAGKLVDCTRVTTDYDEDADTTSEDVETYLAAAVQVPDSPQRYEALKLTQSGLVTLLMATETYGGTIELGDLVAWDVDAPQTVVSVDPTAPDGTPIISRVVIAP